jgi:hypothetical protein
MSTINEPPREKEATGQRAVRSTKNVFTRCFGCIQTSDDKAKIKFKEILIANRQKAFGVLYIDMVRNKSTEEVSLFSFLLNASLVEVGILTFSIT